MNSNPNNSEQQIFETDWLATKPVFYNVLTSRISYSIHDVIDYPNLELHPEGFVNYLESGFSVYGQTPIKNVKFLEPCSRISRESDGKIKIEKLPDPVEVWKNRTAKPEEIIELIRKEIENHERNTQGSIVLPLSGGYDSRILASLVPDKKRIRSFTYGISSNQKASRDAVRAQFVAEKLGIKWDLVELKKINEYIGDWNDQFGPAVHAHGMYHFDFYSRIREMLGTKEPFELLSGIYGDLWAGAIEKRQISSAAELAELSYNHGIGVDKSRSKLISDNKIRDAFWEKNKNSINDEYCQLIMIARQKMILLSYLFSVPEAFGFKPWSPLIMPDIALGMMRLPKEERSGRSWQKKYFASLGLDAESQKLRYNGTNTLDLQALENDPLLQLDEKLLSEAIDETYVAEINTTLKNAKNSLARKRFCQFFFDIPKIHGLLKKLGFKEIYSIYNEEAVAYNAYRVLKPIELALKRRNEKRIK